MKKVDVPEQLQCTESSSPPQQDSLPNRKLSCVRTPSHVLHHLFLLDGKTLRKLNISQDQNCSNSILWRASLCEFDGSSCGSGAHHRLPSSPRQCCTTVCCKAPEPSTAKRTTTRMIMWRWRLMDARSVLLKQ